MLWPGSVQFAECPDLGSLVCRMPCPGSVVCRMPCPDSVQSAECPQMWLYSSQNALTFVLHRLQNALTLDDTTQPSSHYPFISVYLFFRILRNLLASPHSCLPLFTSSTLFNRHFVTFHIKLAQRPLNVTSQLGLHGMSIQWCTEEFSSGKGGSTNSVEDRGQTERGSGGGSPLVRGSEGSCNFVQEISFHIVKSS